MKNKTATLKFNLEDPDSERDFKLAVHSLDMGLVIWELKNNILRSIYKNDLSTEEAVQLIRDELDTLPFNIDDLII